MLGAFVQLSLAFLTKQTIQNSPQINTYAIIDLIFNFLKDYYIRID